MEDLGQPSSYLTLAEGAPVYSCDGEEVGRIEHVLAAPEEDVFDGVVLDSSVLPGGRRFCDAAQIEEIFERGALLKLDRAAAERLPQPSENPAAMGENPAEEPESELESKLKRAWELISGKG
ncbi:MAG: PRC-barrel domain-containing protein [Solirubrobacterales bacterium]